MEKNDSVFIEKELFDRLPQFHLKQDDILLTVVGMKFGKSAVIYQEDCPAIFSCKSTLLRNPIVNVFYLLTYISCEVGYGLIRRGQRGAAQPGINLFDIRNVPVPIFSSSFQTGIETLVKRSKALIIHSESVFNEVQNILLSALGLLNWQPKHRLTFVKNHSHTQHAERIDAEYFQPKYDEIVAAIKTYPGGWDTLGNLVKIKKCVEPGSDEYLDEGIPFVRVSNLSPFEISEEKYISETLYKELTPKEEKATFETSKNHQPQQGEILFTKDATPGIAYYLHETPPEMIPSGGVLRLKLRDKRVSAEYLTLVLNSLIVKEQITRDVGGSVILHWRPDQVKETLIPILPPEKQEQIQQKITESFNMRKQSKYLLECAKRAVEMAIEENEQVAKEWLRQQTELVISEA